ncbi:MAG TPA: DUF4097 family beta strand repeat-containing protein [Terriglobales bacterium]|nr:DUF4097 family beta strand repeat-containing protein [Terriglobales bacterium]
MVNRAEVGQILVMLALCAGVFAADQTSKEFKYSAGPKASVFIVNQYGPITVKPSSTNQIVVVATTHSDKAQVDGSQNGNRILVRSQLLNGATASTGRVDYDVEVPSDASVTLHSFDGPVHAEQLEGDVTVEGDTAVIDLRDLAGGHVHVNTLNGPVTLTNINNGHVEITSVGGDVNMNSVTGSFVEVTSAKGRINYSGDFGYTGNYKLTSHTGDIEAVVPAYASFDVNAASVRGDVVNDFPMNARTQRESPSALQRGRSFVGSAGKAASSVIIRTFSGKIRLTKR